jgi:hypothetical protein
VRTIDPTRRIQQTLEKLSRVIPGAKIAPPATRRKLAQLIDEAGPLAPELNEYFACCDGVSIPGQLGLFSVNDMLRVDTPGFFAIGEDGCGDYDLVARDYGHGAGAVVFWDHELGRAEYLVASSVSVYVEVWAKRAATAASGKRHPALERWPFDLELMARHDPAGATLMRSRRFKAQLGDVDLRHVDRKSRTRERVVVNPFTGEPMVLPKPPTRRRAARQ